MSEINDETLIGIDFGDTNIGIALGRNGFVAPLVTVTGKDRMLAINVIAKHAITNKASRIIMGLPLDDKGLETSQARKVRQFAKLLKTRLKRPVEFINEHGSTQESIKESISQGIGPKGRRKIDHISAAIILKEYYQKEVK